MYHHEPALGHRPALAQALKEEIKQEILEELWARQCRDPLAEGYQGEMVNSRKKLAEEIGRLTGTRGRQGDASELPGRGGKSTPFAGPLPAGPADREGGILQGGMGDPSGDQGKEILYGIGTVMLLGLLLPSFGRRVRAVFARTALEGVELIERARSVAARAREDMEDLIAEASLRLLSKQPRQ